MVDVRALEISGAWEFSPRQYHDSRGIFLEYFAERSFRTAVGVGLDVRQANCSVSGAGVVRGIHFADVPPGQSKYVTCLSGAVLDVVVDIRTGSPTYGRWDCVLLDDVDRRAVYISEGLGHAFMSLQDGSTVAYLCNQPYRPEREHGISPLDPALGITWPDHARDGSPVQPVLSDRDGASPTLDEAAAAGLLPTWTQCRQSVPSPG